MKTKNGVAFVALYRGPTVGEARLLSVTSDPEIVEAFFEALGVDLAEDSPATSLRIARNRDAQEEER